LVDGVAENAINAAFHDPRFPPLEAEELTQVKFEISVLTVPRKLAFNDAEDLERQLQPGVHGVILSRGGRRATFLPQVWDQLPDHESFLGHLCQKGGLEARCWHDPRTTVRVYEAESFEE
jgi:AmmeMemoRadiSam system protein A